MADTATPGLIARRWRALLGAASGLAAGFGAHVLGLPPGFAALVGWNLACVVFLVATGRMMLTEDEATVRAKAAYEDEGARASMAIILAAVGASLGAAVLAMHESKASNAVLRDGALVASATTLILGWLVVQAVFTLRYAHRYFGDADDNGLTDRGAGFPGDPPTSYLDFIYLAVSVGATAAVSDVTITNTRYRQLIAQHAVVAFFFNTSVLALGISIIASLIGQ